MPNIAHQTRPASSTRAALRTNLHVEIGAIRSLVAGADLYRVGGTGQAGGGQRLAGDLGRQVGEAIRHLHVP